MSGVEEPAGTQAAVADSPPFRFYDNRQKYLTFVNTCNEKAVVVKRAAQELAGVRPTPPSLRLFDAGMGDATVLSRMMRTTHQLFPTVPLLAVAKEISLEDVRLGLEKMPDRFYEHGNTVLVITNLSYADAPSLALADPSRGPVNWQVIKLEGTSANEFGDQIELLDLIADNDLIDSVDPVQLSIRLLVPPGSLLLALPEMREHLNGYDPEGFSHLWQHPDPRMDMLQAQIAALVASDADAGVMPRSTHLGVRQLTAQAAADAGLPWPGSGKPLPAQKAAPPRLSEPWFCCAEPTAAQFAAAVVGEGT